VTVDEIAEAADVGRMTVFNHFPRKEDMFFDLDEGGREDLLRAIQQRDPDVAPIEALRLFAHQAVEEQKPYIRFFLGSHRFFEAIKVSEPLKARARAIRDELAQLLAAALACAAGREADDPDAQLIASLLVATWGVAFVEAHRTLVRHQDAAVAQAAFLTIVEKGAVGLKAMMAGTPYA
jgi:AcrR family transcriptional regulator